MIVTNPSHPNLVPNDNNGTIDILVRDLALGRTVRVSVGAQGEGHLGGLRGDISADGRYVAFGSASTNLVAAAPTATPTCSSAASIPGEPNGSH
jgi:hypothetical protein